MSLVDVLDPPHRPLAADPGAPAVRTEAPGSGAAARPDPVGYRAFLRAPARAALGHVLIDGLPDTGRDAAAPLPEER
ncbi:hypothetical protein AB0E21_28170 [Streptomyces sp. NPDC047967]|uniref:hypothetical protein n=1 Tax=unclassified Streptomyces TaxID=2593676 RepID=UPI0033F1291A